MTHGEAKIGDIFTCGGNRWYVTDVGSRVVVAIRLGDQPKVWMLAPPYAVAEEVFDENDLPGCEVVS